MKRKMLGVIACLVGIVFLNGCSTEKVQIKEEHVMVEYGDTVSLNAGDYLSNDEDVLAEVEVSSDIENEEGKEYPAIGEYTLKFTYKKQEAEIKVSVVDTTKPVFVDFKDTVDVYQNGKVDFNALYTASDLGGAVVTFDDSQVDYSVGGSYTAAVTATDSSGNAETKEVTVNVIPVTVQLDKTSASVYAGETVQLKADVNIPEAKATFTSSDSSIATVDENGLVKGVKSGKAVITAELNGVKDECEVTVSKKVVKTTKSSSNKTSTSNSSSSNKGSTTNSSSSSNSSGTTNSDSTSNSGGIPWTYEELLGEPLKQEISKEAFDLINAERVKLGLEPAVWDARCEEIALWRAVQLHDLDRVTQENAHAGFLEWQRADFDNRWMVTECVAWGYGSASGSVTGWMNSKGHRASLMEPDHVKLAVAYFGSRWVAVLSQ